MRLTLTVTAGPHQGREFSFTEHDTFIVGRSSRAHFRLSTKDKYFSRHHFLIEVNPPHCRLLDLGSRNGTFINGVRVPTADLHDGDVITAGRTVINTSIQEGPAPDMASEIALAQTIVKLPTLPRAAEVPTPSTIDYPLPNAEPVTPSTLAPTVSAGSPASPKLPSDVLSPTIQQQSSGPPLCPICGAPASITIAARRTDVHPPLCAACETAAQEHGQPIAGYRMIRELGRGGMGVVDLALRLADARPVALKTIIPQTAATQKDIARFLREASILRTLDHPNIVAFRDMGESNGRFYFAMDYIRGVNGARLLQGYRAGLPVGRAVDLVCQLLDALEYAHVRQFVHRDIKPSNLLVEETHDRAGARRDVVKLGDFGLARMYESASCSGLTMQGDYSGTLPFMPPEQITNFRQSRPANDLYAVGATLYNLLTDRYIYDFPSSIERKVLMLLQDDPVPLRARRPDLPRALAEIVHRSLAREPADRFPTAQAMQEALTSYGK